MSRIAWQKDVLPSGLGAAYQAVGAATTFYLPVFLRDGLGFDGAQIGFLYALFAVCGMLAALPAGLSNDKITSRFLIAVALLLQGVCLFMMSQGSWFVVIAVAFGGWALGQYLFRISLDVQVMRTQGGIGLTQRVYLYQMLRFFGLLGGVVPAGYWLAQYDFRFTLMMVAFVMALLALTARGLEPTPLKPVRLRDYYGDLSRPGVAFFAGWLFLFSLHWGAESTSYGLYLRQVLRLDLIEMGWYFAAEYLTMALVFVVLYLARSDFAEPRQMRAVTVAGLMTSGIGQFVMVNDVVAISLGGRMLHAVGDGLMMVVFYFGIARLFDRSRVGGNTGFINAVTMFGTVVGSLISGVLGEQLGYGIPLQATGALVFLLAFPLLWWRSSTEPLADSLS